MFTYSTKYGAAHNKQLLAIMMIKLRVFVALIDVLIRLLITNAINNKSNCTALHYIDAIKK